jgi:hypothetical protein
MKPSTLLMSLLWLTALPAYAGFEVKEHQGRIEIRDNGKLVFGWQSAPIKKPRGGPEFAGSAFIHPLCTPSGFKLTDAQPSDHLHHFGVWWPWKFLSTDGRKFNTWELQVKQGRHAAVSATVTSKSADEVVLKLVNQSEIKTTADTKYQPVITEQTTLRFARLGKDAYVLDLTIRQEPVKGKNVEVIKYRYSGFSWRGTPDFKKANSQMQTSGGHNRDTANGQTARWAMVSGDVPSGVQKEKATILIMSAAPKNGGTPERLRVWNSKVGTDAQFINFNPVVETTQTMDTQHPGVSSRKYRLILADRAIKPTEAKQLWQVWK